MQDPYDALSLRALIAVCVLALVATLAYGALLKRQGQLLGQKLPAGIVSLEIPWSSAKARSLIDALGPDGVESARLQIRLDFVFLLLYPVALSSLCALAARWAGPGLAVFGMLLAWAVLLTAPLDAIENGAMLQMLNGSTFPPWPQLATVCAALKFSLVFGAAGFAIVATGAWGVRTLSQLLR